VLERLGRKQRAVFDMLVEGYDNQEISQQLNLAEQTVKNYVSEIYAETGVHDRVHLMRWARAQGLT
jgi:DNA-binding NarL/FixJ family response regulator